MPKGRVVLWDIDHTLVDTRGVGRELSAQAFAATTGLPMREQAKIDGITEPVIFRETAKLHGLTTDRADFERFAQTLADAHLQHADLLRRRGRALPGADGVLRAFAADSQWMQTVVSGNVRAVAEIKLATFGLGTHIDWRCGAYGEDNDERAGLVRKALRRSGDAFGLNGPLPPAAAVLFGDTPADVAAALDVGVPVIAVATGRSTAVELRAAGARQVLPDLTDAAAIVRLATTLSHSADLTP